MLTQASVVGVIAIGMTFVIATGGHRPLGRLGARRRRRLRRRPRRPRAARPGLHPRRDRLRDPARHGQRDRDRLRPGRPVHRDPGDVLDRPRARPAAERQAPGRPARPQRRLVRRPGAVLAALVRDRRDPRHPGLGLRLPRDHDRRLDPAQPHPLRPLRGRRRRQPRGGADRRRAGAQGDLQRLRALRPAGRDRDGPALRPARQRLAGQRQPLRARRDRRRGDRRHQPRRAAGRRSSAPSSASSPSRSSSA